MLWTPNDKALVEYFTCRVELERQLDPGETGSTDFDMDVSCLHMFGTEHGKSRDKIMLKAYLQHNIVLLFNSWLYGSAPHLEASYPVIINHERHFRRIFY
jgi:hypothetical protein